eukprot:147636-Prymnesium_polylepis.1
MMSWRRSGVNESRSTILSGSKRKDGRLRAVSASCHNPLGVLHGGHRWDASARASAASDTHVCATLTRAD